MFQRSSNLSAKGDTRTKMGLIRGLHGIDIVVEVDELPASITTDITPETVVADTVTATDVVADTVTTDDVITDTVEIADAFEAGAAGADVAELRATSFCLDTVFATGTPAAQQAVIADAAGGGTVDAEARTALNAVLAALRTFGLIDT